MKRTTFILALALTAITAYAQPQPAPTKKLKYLTEAEIDPSRLLPPPPKDGSEVQAREMAEVKRLMKTRTPERMAQAVWDDQHEDPSAFAATIGPEFDLSKLPATAKLLAEAQNDQSVAASAAKVYFHRKFPVAADPAGAAAYREWSCDPEVKKPGDRQFRSYPSGHATMGYSLGIILAALIPEKSQVILARAADYAYSREVCADHYHSDVEASHALGSAVGIELLNNAALQPMIEAAKAELRAAHVITE
jgi:acid phosphatase (class A)